MPNIYNRPRWELNKFQFGFVHKKIFEDVKLIPQEREGEPIADLIGRTDFFEHDLILCPLSQIPPETQRNDVNDDISQHDIGFDSSDREGDPCEVSHPNAQSAPSSRPATVPKRPDPEPLPDANEILEMSRPRSSSSRSSSRNRDENDGAITPARG